MDVAYWVASTPSFATCLRRMVWDLRAEPKPQVRASQALAKRCRVRRLFATVGDCREIAGPRRCSPAGKPHACTVAFGKTSPEARISC